MYIQRNKNRSGTTTVRVVDRVGGKFTVIHKVGTSSDEGELRRMEEEARIFIDRQKGESLFDYDVAPIAGAEDFKRILTEAIGDLTLVGLDRIYGRIFDWIGDGRIKTRDDALFKSLVVTRLYKPVDGITLKRAMFLSERIYQLGFTNPFSRKEETFILRSKHDDEVNELIRIVAAACDTE